MTDAITVSGLRKSYGKTVALDGLDLAVAQGEVHGFLGPNGSGKTTTIRVLLGLLRADGGTARLLGGDPWSEATALHRRLACVTAFSWIQRSRRARIPRATGRRSRSSRRSPRMLSCCSLTSLLRASIRSWRPLSAPVLMKNGNAGGLSCSRVTSCRRWKRSATG